MKQFHFICVCICVHVLKINNGVKLYCTLPLHKQLLRQQYEVYSPVQAQDRKAGICNIFQYNKLDEPYYIIINES